jgi:hypothetical protein
MPLPHLHLYHPPPCRAGYLLGWIAEVEEALHGDANWDGCAFRRVAYDAQAGFNLATEVDLVRRNLGPAIFIQKVQSHLLTRFREILRRDISVYVISATCPEDILGACEEARRAYEDGEPRIPSRELIAYLILAKLARHGMWGGTSLNKNFLQASDLPKGGFPKDVVNDRDIQGVADALYNAGLLTGKTSGGRMKYALGEKATVQTILDNRHFASVPQLRKYFERSPKQVSARLLSYNEG